MTVQQLTVQEVTVQEVTVQDLTVQEVTVQDLTVQEVTCQAPHFNPANCTYIRYIDGGPNIYDATKLICTTYVN